MKRLLLIALIIPALLIIACGDDGEESPPNGNPAATQSVHPNDEPTPGDDTPAVEPATETPIANVCQPNPSPGTPQTVQIDTPAPFSKHRAKLTVTGKIAAPEATFKIRIFDGNGAVISGAGAMSAEGQVLSPFSQEVLAAVAEEQPACIWVYEESAQDGSPTNVAQVPVVIQP
jgi:hypothetical protein